MVGISGDSVASHRAFVKRLGLQFRMVSDGRGEVRRRWGVPKMLALLPGRVTYVLDRDGVVRLIFNDARHPEQHIQEALAVVRGL